MQEVLTLYPKLAVLCVNPYATRDSIMFTVFYDYPESAWKNPHGLQQYQIYAMIDVIKGHKYEYCLSLKGMTETLPLIISGVFGPDSEELKAFLA